MDSNKKITATVCVYSGRPNPSWIVPVDEYDKLLLAIKALPRAFPVSQPSMLGYTGITIANESTHLSVFNENIIVKEKENVRSYKDAGRVIEKKLVAIMPAALFSEIKNLLPKELQ